MITQYPVKFPEFKTRVRAAFAFFVAGFKTLIGSQPIYFNYVSVLDMPQKDYIEYKQRMLQTINWSEPTKGRDFHATIRF